MTPTVNFTIFPQELPSLERYVHFFSVPLDIPIQGGAFSSKGGGTNLRNRQANSPVDAVGFAALGVLPEGNDRNLQGFPPRERGYERLECRTEAWVCVLVGIVGKRKFQSKF